jgi:hypothetical protein
MTISDEMKEAVLEATIDAYKYQYDKVLANWNATEAKAQATVTIAGLFIGALMAFVHDKPPSRTLGLGEKYAFAFAMAFLLLAVVFSTMALLIRKVPLPPRADLLWEMWVKLSERIHEDMDAPAYLRGFHGEHAKILSTVIKGTNAALDEKKLYLWGAQMTLVGAVLTSAIDLAIRVL